MSHLTVPRRVERILASLGASAEFRQDVLGDLQEEFAIRAAWDGPRVARRWYYRESLRVAPHLLRDWWGRLGLTDIVRLTEGIVWSAIAVVALQSLQTAFVMKVADLLGVPPRRVLSFGFDLSAPQIILVWNTFTAIATGYFAASMSHRARVPGALTTATFWAAFVSVAWFLNSGMFPTWFSITSLLLCFSSIALGGVLRASRGEKSDRVAVE